MEVTIVADLDQGNEWGHVGGELISFFLRDYPQTVIRPIRKNNVQPVFRDKFVKGYRSGPVELLIGYPFFLPTPRKRTVYLTRYRTALNVDYLNRAELVLVPSRWDFQKMKDAGVTSPIKVLRLGFNPSIFSPRRWGPGVCRFGVTARHGDFIHACFREAFARIKDVELSVRVAPNHAFPGWQDPRVVISGEKQPWDKMEAWYHSLSAYIASKEWGLGLSTIEAMACGCPVVGSADGSKTQHLNNENGYPFVMQGKERTRMDNVIAQMRRIYLDQNECSNKRKLAAASVRPWEEVYVELLHHLPIEGIV